jgi:hypothetical protein
MMTSEHRFSIVLALGRIGPHSDCHTNGFKGYRKKKKKKTHSTRRNGCWLESENELCLI